MKKILLQLITSVICFAGCTAQKHTRITSVEAKEFIDKTPDVVIIDVRTPKEFADGHLKGAININVMDEGFQTAIEALDKNKSYLIYCRSGRRSMNAAKIMQRKNFKYIYEISDGFKGWSNNELPLEQ